MQLDKRKDLIFISYQGGIPCANNLLFCLFNSLYKSMKQDKISIWKVTPHGFRHTHATILINNGVPPKTIANHLGNSVEMIYRVNSHSFKELEDKAVSAFNDSLFGAK